MKYKRENTQGITLCSRERCEGVKKGAAFSKLDKMVELSNPEFFEESV